MKILLFKNECLEPFRIYHHSDDVIICNGGKVSIHETGNASSYEFLHLQTELIECDDQAELCLLLFVEENLH